MEGVHGVDVSWLHHANKDPRSQRTPSQTNENAPNSKDSPSTRPSIRRLVSSDKKDSSPAHVTPPSISQAKRDEATAGGNMTSPATSPSINGPAKQSKRPQAISRTSERSLDEGAKASRRPGWINNISSKFSSQNTPTRSSQPLKSPPVNAPNGTEEVEKTEPYASPKPKETSFFSNLTRRLSAASQTSSTSKTFGSGPISQRRILNVDPNRERCLVPELDVNKLRKVSFCVDVEIAGGPKYRDDPEDELEKKRKKTQVKLKEKAEGDALKQHADVNTPDEKDAGRSRAASDVQDNVSNGRTSTENEVNTDSLPRDSIDGANLDKKKEKKKRSEAERKERKEQRLRRAQESGAIPVEIGGDDSEENERSPDTPAPDPTSPIKKNSRPTTDPARIYRRCCQLRESPILKRITEQLMSPKTTVPNEPGVVSCLDLTGSRMQLPDVITLGDWLAVVPVKRLLLEDADLNDEGVRVVLAGLLAAKKPEPTKRKSLTPRHRENIPPHYYQERSGVVEKVTFKNNPRITKVGWRHISLFIYMCRSIKAVDVSMLKFPDFLPASTTTSPTTKSPTDPPTSLPKDVDSAEILYKCLSERLGGNGLEELSMSACKLRSHHIRKIVDGAMVCGVSRLGLAGNDLDDAGLDHVMNYLKSGVCQGIDLGGNNLRGKLDRIANSLTHRPDIPCWGLSLADCSLDSTSVKTLLPALVALPNFRFIDLSHNRDLCTEGTESQTVISHIRRYLPQMKELKRIHLNDVGMTSKQAIALAEILPEGPKLAHVSVLENPKLSALAHETDEASQEEACALYASFMIAVRCSKTLICIDIDVSTGRSNILHKLMTCQVPSNDCSEIVKALAKQVVAYSLQNMEDFAITEITGDTELANAATSLAAPHGGEKGVKNASYPEVLMHLVGHIDGIPDSQDTDTPAPDDDYIVGGTGVVKALQYVLGEKAEDLRRSSVPGSPAAGLPRERPGSSAGLDKVGQAKAREMSKSLLTTARKIRQRLSPAIVKETVAGDEMAVRRLQFLDSTLQSMISRFEEEYPECRVRDQASAFLEPPNIKRTNAGGVELAVPPDLDLAADEDEDDNVNNTSLTRHNSDASLASRHMTLEEGRLFRHGQKLRRNLTQTSSPLTVSDDNDNTDEKERLDKERKRLKALATEIENIPGETIRELVEKNGWAAVLKQLGTSYEDLRWIQEQDEEAWEQFTDAQMKAKMNMDRDNMF